MSWPSVLGPVQTRSTKMWEYDGGGIPGNGDGAAGGAGDGQITPPDQGGRRDDAAVP